MKKDTIFLTSVLFGLLFTVDSLFCMEKKSVLGVCSYENELHLVVPDLYTTHRVITLSCYNTNRLLNDDFWNSNSATKVHISFDYESKNVGMIFSQALHKKVNEQMFNSQLQNDTQKDEQINFVYNSYTGDQKPVLWYFPRQVQSMKECAETVPLPTNYQDVPTQMDAWKKEKEEEKLKQEQELIAYKKEQQKAWEEYKERIKPDLEKLDEIIKKQAEFEKNRTPLHIDKSNEVPITNKYMFALVDNEDSQNITHTGIISINFFTGDCVVELGKDDGEKCTISIREKIDFSQDIERIQKKFDAQENLRLLCTPVDGGESFFCEIIAFNRKEISRSTRLYLETDSIESSKKPDNLTAAEQPNKQTTQQKLIAQHKKPSTKIVKDNSRQRWLMFGGLGLVCLFCMYKYFGYKYVPIF
jgi:hypothetical protein